MRGLTNEPIRNIDWLMQSKIWAMGIILENTHDAPPTITATRALWGVDSETIADSDRSNSARIKSLASPFLWSSTLAHDSNSYGKERLLAQGTAA